MTWRSVRTVGRVTVHLAGGLAVAVLIFAGVPAAAVVLVAVVTGAPVDVAGTALPTDADTARAGIAALAVGTAAAALLGSWVAGRLARRLAGAFLGPTWRDQWELAEARLATEAAHRRLARELHDGIRHALTIISVQATAARRAGGPGATQHGLQVIEQTAHDALGELDSMLAVLRDGDQDLSRSRLRDPDLDDLPALLDRHRSAGMDVSGVVEIPRDLPLVVSRVACRSATPAKALTARERDGLALLAQGLGNAAIADRLVLGTETIRTHVASLLRKLGARDRTHAVVLAYETDLVRLPR